MTNDERTQAPDETPLQFDTAEPPAGSGGAMMALACSACGTEIPTSYFEVNGSIVCSSCRTRVLTQFTGGSGSRRFVRAVGLGLLAAAAGSALYYAILRLTGYEIGLVAIVVGFIVGSAVRRGSQGRGGRSYQMLAVSLTYFAIVSTYIPYIVKGAADGAAETSVDTTRATARSDSVSATATAAIATQQGAPAESSAAPIAAEPVVEQVTAVRFALALGALLLFAAAMPVLAGFQNILGMLIIGFALYEAWRQNQKLELAVTGPYRVGAVHGAGAAGTSG